MSGRRLGERCAVAKQKATMSVTGILHQAQGKHVIARLAALIFLLQIARAQD
jgi:hypothetical protein